MAKETTKPAFYQQWLAAIIQKASNIWVPHRTNGHQDKWVPNQWVRVSLLVQGNNCPEPICPRIIQNISSQWGVKIKHWRGKAYKQSLSKCKIKSGKIFLFPIPTCQKLFFFQTFSAWKTVLFWLLNKVSSVVLKTSNPWSKSINIQCILPSTFKGCFYIKLKFLAPNNDTQWKKI